MAGAMTELTLDVVGAALFGHQFGDLAREMRTRRHRRAARRPRSPRGC